MSGTPTPRFGRALRLFMPVVLAALFVVPFVGAAKVKDHPTGPKGAANVIGAPAANPAAPSDNSAADAAQPADPAAPQDQQTPAADTPAQADPANADNPAADQGNGDYSAASIAAPAAQAAGADNAVTYARTEGDDHGNGQGHDHGQGDDKGKSKDKSKGDDHGKGENPGHNKAENPGHNKAENPGHNKDENPGHNKDHGKGHGDDADHNGPGNSSAPANAPALTPISTPSTTRRVCTSRRSVTIRLDRGYRVRAATVMLNGKVIRVHYGKRVTAKVSLHGQAKGTYTVRTAVLTKGGRVRIHTRRFMTCAVKRIPARKPR